MEPRSWGIKRDCFVACAPRNDGELSLRAAGEAISLSGSELCALSSGLNKETVKHNNTVIVVSFLIIKSSLFRPLSPLKGYPANREKAKNEGVFYSGIEIRLKIKDQRPKTKIQRSVFGLWSTKLTSYGSFGSFADLGLG